MKKNELRPQEIKEPRTVKMYHVVYCTLIALALVGGIITGWTLHVNQQAQVKAEAITITELAVKSIQPKVETSK